MSKLQKERLNQMIENALSYKQEVKLLKSNSFYERFKALNLKPKIYGLIFAPLIILILLALIFPITVPKIMTSSASIVP